MVPLHHWITLTKSGEESPPVPPPPTAKGGGGEDTLFKNCAKKRRVGTTKANLYTPFFTDMTSLCAPLEIEGHTYEDGETKPAPATVNIEGAERGKEKGTAPATATTAPEQPACLAGGACCNCRLKSLCKTIRCACRRVGCNCLSCWCLVRCANVAPQTQQDEQRTTRKGPGDGEGQQKGKRRRGREKRAAARARAGETVGATNVETEEKSLG